MSDAKRFDAVGFGIAAVDYLGIVPRFPGQDEKVRMSALTRQGGGLVGTALAACARLGLRTSYFGKSGEGEYSRIMVEDFEALGVDTSGMVRDPAFSPPAAFVLVHEETGERRICWHWDTPAELQPDQLNVDYILASRVLLLDFYNADADRRAIDAAREHGVITLVDADHANPAADEIIARVDYVVASKHFAVDHTGEADPERALAALAGQCPGAVVVTLGEEGALAMVDSDVHHQPAFPVEVVDTTGAGDVYHGAFAAGLVSGWPLLKIMEFSAGVAALSCTGLGGRAATPAWEEAVEFLRAQDTRFVWEGNLTRG